MHRSARQRRFPLLVFLATALLAVPALSDDITLDAIRKRYEDTLSALANLDVEYRVQQSMIGFDIRQGNFADDQFMTIHWTRDGDRWLYEIPPFDFPGTEGWLSMYHSSDGAFGYQIRRDSADPTRIVDVMKMHPAAPWEPPAEKDPERFVGLLLNVTDRTLGELLRDPHTVLVGSEMVDEHECWRVDCSDVSDEGAVHPFVLIAWLDPEYGFLPRAIDQERVAGDYKCSLRIESFQSVNDEATGGSNVFPHDARMTTISPARDITVERHVIFDHVVLNPTLPVSYFVPEIPNGVPLIERLDEKEMRRSIVGGTPEMMRTTASDIERMATAGVVSNTDPALLHPVVEVPPPSAYSAALAVAMCAVAVLVTGLWVWRRSARMR